MTYQNRTHDEWRRLDAAHHLHPFTDSQSLRAEGSRVISRADGCYIYDVDGAKILDAMAGLWCVNVGYGREELAKVAYEQMRELPYYHGFFKTSTPAAIQLAEKLAEVTPPGLDQVFYGSSGSESNDTVIRLVRHFWALEGAPERQVIISRKMGYHGSTIAAASLGGMAGMHKQIHTMLPGIEHAMAPYYFGDAEPGESEEDFARRAAQSVEDLILEAGADKVAAFIGEPIMGAAGVKTPPKGYWTRIQEICRKHDILLVADEVICGFGRTGQWFGSETYDITPDLMTVAKGLTSGYLPLSAVIVGERVSKTIVEKAGELTHGYTYSGHPVPCAVGLANIEIIQREGLVERAREDAGPKLAAALKSLEDHPLVGETRLVGLMGAIELVKDKASRERLAPDGAAGTVCRDHCFAENLILRATGDTMVLSPPLIFGEAEIEELASKARRALDATLETAKSRGWLD